jgi:two-component system, NarL family, invasion response regulator UvrY
LDRPGPPAAPLGAQGAAASDPVANPAVPIDVLTVDDSLLFLRTASELIEATPGFRCIGTATSGAAGLSAAERLHPDLVLLDLRMPDMDGIDVARRLHDASPRVVILLVSTDDLADVSNAARTCGAAGFVRKDRLSPRTLRNLWARAAGLRAR